MKTYGEMEMVTRGGRETWRIKCEPHVMIALKRVFQGVSKSSMGEAFITNTPANCREIEWFLSRYPMELAEPEQLHAGANEQRAIETEIFSLMDGTYLPPEFDLAVPLREYQKIPPAMTLRTGGLLVADDVGVGKTAMGIALFADPRALPALVVTLTHLPRQWKAEIERFAPKLRVEIVKTGTPRVEDEQAKKRQKLLFSNFPDVLIMNYHKLAGWAESLAPIVKSVVFDEAHELRREGPRNKPSQKYAAAKHLSRAVLYRMGLTATPIYNYGSEMYPVLDVIRPGSLGTHEEFIREWCSGYVDSKGRAKIKDPKAFGSYARDAGLMLRRTRADVGRELPALTRVPHYVDADLTAIQKIGDAAAELATIILRQGESRRGEKMLASEEFNTALRQATGIAKAPFVAEFVRMLIESGEKVVLYGWHREVYSIWLSRLKDLNPVMFTGSESEPQKDAARKAFVEGESPLLIMSLGSGAGLDGLQKVCRTVVIGELSWSAGTHEQCIGRIYRDGQPDPVTAYFLISDFGADPTMVDVLALKRQQLEGVRDPYAAAVEQTPNIGQHVKQLAEDFLRSRGRAIPEPEVAA